MSEILPYSDPLIELLKDPNLNKEKEKAQELIRFINDIDDQQIKSWCIEAFEILRDLEKIEVKINNWEFQTLDFNLSQSFLLNDEDVKRRKFNSELAKRVSASCLDLHKISNELAIEIDELHNFNKKLSPIQRISDPGTILTELSIRVIKLQNQLSDEISIHYSKARLVNIGIDLENLIYDEEELEDESEGSITAETVFNYKNFINNLLQQLNDSVSSGDTIGAMECISVVNDVEKMFDTMKMQKLQSRQRKEKRVLPTHFTDLEDDQFFDHVDNESPSSSTMTFDDTLYGDDDDEDDGEDEDEDEPVAKNANQSLSTVKIDQRRQRRFNNSQSNRLSMNLEDSGLHRTTFAEKLPFLMTAFEEAKQTEEELKEFISSPIKKKKSRNARSKKSSTSADTQNRPKSKLSEQLTNELDADGSDSENRENESKRTYSVTSTGTDSSSTTLGTSVTAQNIPKHAPVPSQPMPHLLSSTPPTTSTHIHPPSLSSSTSSLPNPYFQNSLLNAFFKPQTKEPIYVDPLPSSDVSNESTVVTTSKTPTSSKQAIANKLMRYKTEEDKKELTLSPKKITAIQLGSGRVKETVKDIEDQLPTGIKPPAPLFSPDDSSAYSGKKTASVLGSLPFGGFWGSSTSNAKLMTPGTGIGKHNSTSATPLAPTNAPAFHDFTFHDIDNLID